MTYFSAVVISLSSYAQMRNADISNTNDKDLDIPYATRSDVQKLDIYLPDEGVGPFPVILPVYGVA